MHCEPRLRLGNLPGIFARFAGLLMLDNLHDVFVRIVGLLTLNNYHYLLESVLPGR